MAGPWDKYNKTTAQNQEQISNISPEGLDKSLPVQGKPAPFVSGTNSPWLKYQTTNNSNLNIPTDDQSMIGNIAKGAIGVSVGVAENANPLAVPHSLEVLGRAAFSENGNVFDRLKSAEKNSVIPNINISQIAAGLRTLAISPFSDKPIKEIYNDELKSQQDFNQNFIPSGTKEAGEIGAGIISLGLLAQDISKISGLSQKVDSLANMNAYDALKPIGRSADKIIDQGRAAVIGEQLLKDKIITPGATFKDILKRTDTKLKDYGNEIGYYAKAADEAVQRDSSIQGIPVADLANDITSKVINPLKEDPSTVAAAQQVSDWVDNLKTITKENGELSFQQAQNIKTNLGAVKAKFKSTADSISHDAFQDVYRVLNDSIENGIDNALKEAAPDIVNGFEDAKTAYRNLSDARSLIARTVSRQEKNRAFSLTDYMSGGTGGIVASSLLGPKGIVAAPIAAIGNKVLRERGNQISASALKGLSGLINKDVSTSDIANSLMGIVNYLGEKKDATQ